MTITLKISADAVPDGMRARVQVVGAPSAATEVFLVEDTKTEVKINLYGNRRAMITEEAIPASEVAAKAAAVKEEGDTTAGTATQAPGTTGSAT